MCITSCLNVSSAEISPLVEHLGSVSEAAFWGACFCPAAGQPLLVSGCNHSYDDKSAVSEKKYLTEVTNDRVG